MSPAAYQTLEEPDGSIGWSFQAVDGQDRPSGPLPDEGHANSSQVHCQPHNPDCPEMRRV